MSATIDDIEKILGTTKPIMFTLSLRKSDITDKEAWMLFFADAALQTWEKCKGDVNQNDFVVIIRFMTLSEKVKFAVPEEPT